MFPISFIPLCIYICRYLHTYLFPSFFRIIYYLDVLIILNISIPVLLFNAFSISIRQSPSLSPTLSPSDYPPFTLSLSHLSFSPSYAHGFAYVSILSKFLKFRSDSHTYVIYIIIILCSYYLPLYLSISPLPMFTLVLFYHKIM